MKSYVYIIIDNSIDERGHPREKFYIGKSNNPQRRFAAHIRAALSGKDNVFYRAILSHGFQNFSIFQVYECDSEEIAFEKEKSLIQEYRTYIGFEDCRGYNSTLGGDGFDSFSASFYAKKDWDLNYESRCKVNKSRWESEEEKEKQSKKLCEVLSSEEQKNKKHKKTQKTFFLFFFVCFVFIFVLFVLFVALSRLFLMGVSVDPGPVLSDSAYK